MSNYIDLTAYASLVGLVVWYIKTQTKAQIKRETKSDTERIVLQAQRDKDQKEERNYYRVLIQGGLRDNAVLNAKSLSLQKKMVKDFKDHNGYSEKFSEKVIETLSIMCGKLNEDSPDMSLAKRKLDKGRGKKNIKVEVDRRK